MRADRLLKLLLTLQSHGKQTARELAEELEVSERTVYRDIEALSGAGVPVYTERGPGGGCALLDNYRTSLTGLSEDEIAALFASGIPAPLDELGVKRELKTALLKLAAALQGRSPEVESDFRPKVYIDWDNSQDGQEGLPHLHALRRATWENRKVRCTYRLWSDWTATRCLDAYGLVASGGRWFLVAWGGNHTRVIKVADVLDVEALPESFTRPDGFDLKEFWIKWKEKSAAAASRLQVVVQVSAPSVVTVARDLAPHIVSSSAEAPEEGGSSPWGKEGDIVTMELAFDNISQARTKLLPLGKAVEVLEPLALRMTIADYAEQTLRLYR